MAREQDRPLECSACQKPISCCMKEITLTSSTAVYTCSECPLLKSKIHSTDKEAILTASETKLCCRHCHTSYEAIARGEFLGCGECYEVFRDKIIDDLNQLSLWAPPRKGCLDPKKISMHHIGLKPNPSNTMKPSDEIYKLNQALNTALQRENYEEAAWIRDQIKAILSKTED